MPAEEIRLPPINQKDHHYTDGLPEQPNTAKVTSPQSPDSPHYDSDGTVTGTEDEFDWDHEDGGTGKTQQGKNKQVKGKRLRYVWLLFMKLSRFVRTLLVAVLGAGFFITPLLVVTFQFRESPVRRHVYAWSLWLSIIWAASCVTYLVVDLFPRLIIIVVNLFGGQVERLKTQIELTSAVSGWLKLTLDIVWAWVSLSVIREVYKPPGSYWYIINRVMQALFASGVILLVEKLFLHFVAINFHEKALADRLAENRLGLKALDRLSNAQPVYNKKAPYGKKAGQVHKSMASSLGNIDHHDRGHKENRSKDSHEKHHKGGKRDLKKERRKRKKAITEVIVDQVGGAIGQVALKDSKFNKENDLGGLHSARRLARKLFSTLTDVYPPRQHLIVDDFYPYFKSQEEAIAAFALFDKDTNGDISRREMREAVQRIYGERKALVASLKDVGSAVAKLDAVLSTLALVIVIFVCMLIFNRENTLASLVPMATLVLGFSFIFGNAAATLFESLIFIFSTHVFDVGDLVLIDDQPLFVIEFGLFSTTFRRTDGQYVVAPNNLLANAKTIHNVRRSNSMWETTTIMIAYTTPLETIEEIKTRVGVWMGDHSREWNGYAVNIDKLENQNAIHLVIAIEHRSNWQDWGGRWARRNEFMKALKEILQDLDISYMLPTQPILMPHAPAPGRRGRSTSSRPHGLGNAGLGNSGSVNAGRYHMAPTRGVRIAEEGGG
ncbi:Mechanosensitive ion channel-domain-containing protein [Pterulicium gracile]|uniref:Mechanosensitive ion channel-domain-containing protein n=1 Tax=Pterulicium gracile TaxID=1884261 RepID=A0A5C3QZH4_9AGAR|nr:Mechanosensitive ion channel-domain-containing protein [Pterula gracilis]